MSKIEGLLQLKSKPIPSTLELLRKRLLLEQDETCHYDEATSTLRLDLRRSRHGTLSAMLALDRFAVGYCDQAQVVFVDDIAAALGPAATKNAAMIRHIKREMELLQGSLDYLEALERKAHDHL